MRTWQVERRKRTRHLIELGGLVVKAGLVNLIGDDRATMLDLLARALDREANYDAGCSLVRKLRFLDKLEEEIDEALESLHEAAR